MWGPRLLGSLGVVCAALGTASAGSALDKPAFTATPAELLAEARTAPAGDADVVVLRDEAVLAFDAAGRETLTLRLVFVVRRQAAIDDWGTLEDQYEPFYQDKPAIRIRVVASDGTTAELDPSLVTDAPAVDDGPDVLSDRHVVHAPLPHLAVGAVVEQQIIDRDRQPLLGAGVIDGRSIGRVVPVQRTIVTIRAPVARPVHLATRGFTAPPRPRKSTAKGVATWVFDFGPTPARELREDDVPGDVFTWPWVGVSTAASWAAVANDYRQQVERRLAAGPFTAPAGLRGATERETVDRSVAWLHQHVRYTGIEFSDAEIVPWPPAETVKRGFGDCKDEATLLVALLRAQGIRADVVLLDTGPGTDVVQELPGMGPFDHAIVRAVVDGKPLWIDGTEDALPAGQLPARDLGRHALVIAPGTRDLVVTPEATAAASVIREVRTYQLAEYEDASVTERETETGTFASDLRTWFRDGKHDDLQRSLSRYADTTYHGELASFTGSDPADVSMPFELTLELAKVSRAFTDRNVIDVYLFPSDTLDNIPKLLSDEHATARKSEFQWLSPHVTEIENRLVVPSGYTIPSLAPHEQVSVGTMTLTTDRRVDGNTIVITYRLDTGKPRLTAAEVDATRDAVVALSKHDGEHIAIPLTSALLVEQGHNRQAIAECRRLIALHPKEALHEGQLAEVYRKSGMGAAARRAARDGVKVQPIADAYDMLGFELRHDTLGRDRGPDADRAGAIAAYRKALELDPKHLGALTELAALLASDARGFPTDVAKDRAEAIALWRRAKQVADSTDYDEHIVEQLLLAGELADAEATARAMPESAARSKFLVAAAAASRGATAAFEVAASLGDEHGRDKLLVSAATELLAMRRYDAARALLAQAQSSSTTPGFAALIQRIAPVALDKLDPADPRTPVIDSMVFEGGTHVARPPWDARVGKDLQDQAARSGASRSNAAWLLLPESVRDDVLAAFATMTVAGDRGAGWRISIEGGARKAAMYVIADHGIARLVGGSGMETGVGRHLLELAAHGSTRTASTWTQWIGEDLELTAASQAHDAELVSWLKEEEAAAPGGVLPRDVIEVVGAALVVKGSPELAVPILRRCAPKSAGAKKLCRAFLVTALVTQHKWNDLAEVERQILEQDAGGTEAVAARAAALGEAGKLADAIQLVDDALARTPDELQLLRIRTRLAVAGGHADEVRAARAAELACPRANAEDYNDAAWSALFFGFDLGEARELATRSERLAGSVSRPLANTIAAIEAEQGHPGAAWQYALQSIGDIEEPHADDWYVIGRIAELYGLRDDAIAAYRKVLKVKPDPLTRGGGYDLARRGLARLGVH